MISATQKIVGHVQSTYKVDRSDVMIEVRFDVLNGHGWRELVEVGVYVVNIKPHGRMLICTEVGSSLGEVVMKISRALTERRAQCAS